MAVCTHCKKPFSLTSHSLVTRVSAYTVLEFDCVECLIQYCNDNTNAYWEEAKSLLDMYISFNRETRGGAMAVTVSKRHSTMAVQYNDGHL